MRGKKLPALRQRYRMRKHLLNLFELRSRQGDQVVLNAQQHLALNRYRMLQQQVIVLEHRSGQAVLNRQHGRVRRS